MCSNGNQRSGSGLYRAAGFSSMSLGSLNRTRVSCGPYIGCHITPVSVDRTLLTELNLDLDETQKTLCKDEKDHIKDLNSTFLGLIVKDFPAEEKRNKELETKWKLMQELTTASSDIGPTKKVYISTLNGKLDMVMEHKSRLELESLSIAKSVKDYEKKYEEEVIKRAKAEKDFLALKKKVDEDYVAQVDREVKVTSLVEDIKIFRTLYDMELCELKEHLKGLSVVVQMDNSRGLDIDQIVSDVKVQYEEIAARSRTEVESWYKVKFDQITSTTIKTDGQLSETTREIEEITYQIKRRTKDIKYVEDQCKRVDDKISEAEESGKKAVKEAQERIDALQRGLQIDRHNMAKQMKIYQDLMNAKLALDIEIATYGKLLEGEEGRIGHQSIISISNSNGQYYEPPCTHPKDPAPCCEEQPWLFYPSCGRVPSEKESRPDPIICIRPVSPSRAPDPEVTVTVTYIPEIETKTSPDVKE